MSASDRDALHAAWNGFAGGAQVGPTFFEDAGLAQSSARGIVEQIDGLGDPGVVLPDGVRAFFERTSDFDLLIAPSWRAGFLPGAWLARGVSSIIGQLRYPVGESRVATRIVSLGPGTRGCVRTFEAGKDAGKVMHVAAYAPWRGFLSVAFPVPQATIGAVLRLEAVESGGVALSSKRGDDEAGTWLVRNGSRVAIPFDESLALWPASGAPARIDLGRWPNSTIVGEHVQRIFGVRYVTYTYWLRPLS